MTAPRNTRPRPCSTRSPRGATWATLAGRRVAIVGDVLHSRVARSNALLLQALGAEVTLVAPPTLLPYGVDSWGVATSTSTRCRRGRRGDDAAVQRERMNASFFPTVREYSRRYGLDGRRMATLQDHTIVMHPGPDDPGHGDHRRRRLGPVGDRRAGDQRGGADGRACCWAATSPRWAPPTPSPGTTARQSARGGVPHHGSRHPGRRAVDLLTTTAASRRSAPCRRLRRRDDRRDRAGRAARAGRPAHPPARAAGRTPRPSRPAPRPPALNGFTAVHAMANTDPVADTAGVVEQVWRLGREADCDVYPVGAVTVGWPASGWPSSARWPTPPRASGSSPTTASA